MPDHPPPRIPETHVDPFFVLRDCRTLFIRRLIEIARQCGVIHAGTLDALAGAVVEAHDELASSAQKEGFEQTDGLTASRISLVGNDDLELEIRIGDMISHLKDDEHIGHWRVQLRYMSLLQRPGMTADGNPLGLESIRQGMHAMCRHLGGSLEQQFTLLGLLENALKARLPELYEELNHLLEQKGVPPAQAQLIRRTAPAGATQSSGREAPDALVSLHRKVGLQRGTAAQPAATAVDAALSASTLVMLNQLIERLNAIALQQPAPVGPTTEDTACAASRKRPLRAQDLDLPAGTPTGIILDTLALIFERIFAFADLPDAVKTSLGRLQIPLLKQAILDPHFFADTRHPARQLVNRMARAAVGLPRDIPHEHPLSQRLARIAEAVSTAAQAPGNADFSTHISELDSLIGERDAAVQAAAEPFVRLVSAHEKRELARAHTEAWLKKTLTRTDAPAIVRFITLHWARVMQQAAGLAEGVEGRAWKEQGNVIDDVLWSLQPKQTADERSRLISLLPSLLKKINGGLDEIAVPQEERKPFLDACFTLQTEALRGKNAAVSTPVQESVVPVPLTPADSKTAPALRILEDDGIRVKYIGMDGTPPTSTWRSGLKSPYDGNWLTFHLPDGQQLCGRSCWQGEASRTLLLSNPDWGYAVAMAAPILERQIRAGEARHTCRIQLFDEAAGQALDRLQRMAPGPKGE